jgi:putative pyruvate formate lyase activating enzyme
MTSRPSRFTPAYLAPLESGDLHRRVEEAYERMRVCDLCGRRCRVDRYRGYRGTGCLTGELALVHGGAPHHGEEAPLSGWCGSGTLFFGSCNLQCVYCQNWELSAGRAGRETEPEEIATMLLSLQDRGCHNINFVSPSHVVAQLLAAVEIAAHRGLRLPLVYNSGGYDSMEALALLDGVIDIYMPDMKYGDDLTALRLSRVKRYVEVNRAAVREMHRQVGDLEIDDHGLARRGLLVRHLILPGNLAGTAGVMRFLAREVSAETYVNIMDQYRPCHRAVAHPPLDRRVTREEFDRALADARAAGLHRFDGLD